MKKRMILAALLCLALPLAALAEEPPADKAYTWEYLASIGGTAAAVLLIVQYIKRGLDKVRHIPTRAVVLVLAVGLQLGSAAVLHGLNWPDVPLLVLNGFVAATSAMGMYEVTFAKGDAAHDAA